MHFVISSFDGRMYRTYRSLSSELLSSRSAPNLYWCAWLFLPRCRTLHLLLLNLERFLSAQVSSLSSSCYCISHSSQLSIICRLAPFIQVADEDCWTRSDPEPTPCGTLLGTGLQLHIAPLITTLWVSLSLFLFFLPQLTCWESLMNWIYSAFVLLFPIILATSYSIVLHVHAVPSTARVF